MKVLSKPLRGRSKFIVSTAWHTSRQIYTAPLHHAELTPTLQGFFYAGGNIGDEVEDLPLTKKILYSGGFPALLEWNICRALR